MMSQREADLALLMSVYSRAESGNPPSQKLLRVQNSLTAGGYMTIEQFDNALDTLLGLQMVEAENAEESRLAITPHGATWLMGNFHWVSGDRMTLEPNDEAWVMTPPEPRSSSPISEVEDS